MKRSHSSGMRPGWKPILLTVLTGTCLAATAQKTVVYGEEITEKDSVSRGFHPQAGSNTYYNIYVGATYEIIRYQNNKQPYAARHTFGLNYSISENSLHPYYQGFFPQLLGPCDLSVTAGYDGIRRLNYFGLGNETHKESQNIRFHWMRTHHQYASLGVGRSFGKRHRLTGELLYDGVQVLDVPNRYISRSRGTIDPAAFKWQHFATGKLSYTYQQLNNELLPTKGFNAVATGGYTEDLKQGGHSFFRYTADATAYIPLTGDFSYVFRSGLATLTGQPVFYQYNAIGSGQTLRGYHQWRFFGKTAFYNQNELRWIRSVSRGSINGHFGLLGIYDLGRVWLPWEASSKLHYGYGGGVLLAPFDRIVATGVFAVSNEDRRFHFTLAGLF